MSTQFEAPLQGPLDNPDWTDEENRAYDKAENFNTPQLAREGALRGDPVVDPFVEAPAAARRTLDEGSAHTSEPVSDYMGSIEARAAHGLRKDQEIRDEDRRTRQAEEDALRTDPEPEVSKRLEDLSSRYGS